MGKLYNNDENEFSDLVKTLKELPRLKAPDNFEYNLLVKIKNKNFETSESPKPKVFGGWRLVPATALVLSVLILFFVFTGDEVETDNPFLEDPRPRENVTPVAKDAAIAGQLSNPEQKNSESVQGEAAREEAFATQTENSLADTDEKVYPFSKNNNVEIDKFLNGETLPRSAVRSPVLVRDSKFNGFWIRERSNQNDIQEMKAKFDSVMRSTKNVDTKKTKTE